MNMSCCQMQDFRQQWFLEIPGIDPGIFCIPIRALSVQLQSLLRDYFKTLSNTVIATDQSLKCQLLM